MCYTCCFGGISRSIVTGRRTQGCRAGSLQRSRGCLETGVVVEPRRLAVVGKARVHHVEPSPDPKCLSCFHAKNKGSFFIPVSIYGIKLDKNYRRSVLSRASTWT